MGLRLLSYMVRIWKRQARERGFSGKLSPILPLVLAQDKEHWKTSTRFHELFTFPQGGWEAVQTCTPDFAFRLLQHFNKGTQTVLTNRKYLVLRN